MSYNYSKLSAKIVEVFGTQRDFAKAMGRSERTISLKMNNKLPWTQAEMEKAGRLLNVSVLDFPEYFFKLKVQLN